MTESHRDTEQVLSGIRIVELGTDVAAAYAARLCAIYGADVITVEPPEGHPVGFRSAVLYIPERFHHSLT